MAKAEGGPKDGTFRPIATLMVGDVCWIGGMIPNDGEDDKRAAVSRRRRPYS